MSELTTTRIRAAAERLGLTMMWRTGPLPGRDHRRVAWTARLGSRPVGGWWPPRRGCCGTC